MPCQLFLSLHNRRLLRFGYGLSRTGHGECVCVSRSARLARGRARSGRYGELCMRGVQGASRRETARAPLATRAHTSTRGARLLQPSAASRHTRDGALTYGGRHGHPPDGLRPRVCEQRAAGRQMAASETARAGARRRRPAAWCLAPRARALRAPSRRVRLTSVPTQRQRPRPHPRHLPSARASPSARTLRGGRGVEEARSGRGRVPLLQPRRGAGAHRRGDGPARHTQHAPPLATAAAAAAAAAAVAAAAV